MHRILRILGIFVVAAATLGAQTVALPTVPKPGAMLMPGTMLIYSSGGVETPWTMDSVAVDTTIAGRSGCTRLKLRLSPAARQQTRAFCADSATLWRWSDSTQTLRVERPIKEGGTFSVSSPRGTTVYETGKPTTEKIGGAEVWVIPTTVWTRDANGRVIRKLTENYALGLLSATRGTFEVPDSTRAGQWVVQQRFELVGITGTRPPLPVRP
jgi:hypothetical protein